MKMTRWILSIVILVLLAGCNGSDNDSAAPSEATAVSAMRAQIATLQSQLSSIQGEIPRNLIVAHAGSAVTMRTLAIGVGTEAPSATTTATFTATFLGSPTGSVFGMTQQVGMTSSNYLFLSNVDGTVESAGLPVTILYEAQNCQGPAFTILAAGISQANVNQGIVFGTGPIGDTVAADYLMLKAGQAPQPDFANSELQATPGGGTCVNINPGPNNYAATYPLVTNDPTVSKIPSGPFSPTTLGP